MDTDKEIAKLMDELGRLLQQQRPGDEFSGLTVLNVQILTFLVFSDAAPKMRDVAEAVGLSLPSASAIIDRLEESNLVSRGHDPQDRRVVLVRLTEKGRSIIQAHIDQTVTGITKGLSGLSYSNKRVVLSFFQAFTTAMKEAAMPSHVTDVKSEN